MYLDQIQWSFNSILAIPTLQAVHGYTNRQRHSIPAYQSIPQNRNMTAHKKHVVFDVVGTCVSYDNFFDAIETRLGPKLRAEGIQSRFFGFSWMETAEREYTYLSISGAYVPFWSVFKPLFYRMLWMAGIKEPRDFATDEDAEFLVQSYRKLKARPGIDECFARLRESGFTVWALTAGDTERVNGYFTQNKIDMPIENFVSCDSFGVGKPAPESYTPLLNKFNGEEAWFAAAHMWDASAAKRNGYVTMEKVQVTKTNFMCRFKGAWCSVWEKEPCTEVFGELDVLADTLPEMAEKIIAASS